MEDPMAVTPEVVPVPMPVDGEAKVKPALVKNKKARRKKSGVLKWDEAKIQEHDLLRGTRMKIEEPDTPYHHNYDSGSETDGSHNANKNPENQLSWDHLQNKLDAAAAAQDAYPSSPSSHGGTEVDEERRKKELKELEFKEHRKRHYNEMELVRRFRQEHSEILTDEEDQDNDADDEN
jgi:protein phosphatase inhibitor 2